MNFIKGIRTGFAAGFSVSAGNHMNAAIRQLEGIGDTLGRLDAGEIGKTRALGEAMAGGVTATFSALKNNSAFAASTISNMRAPGTRAIGTGMLLGAATPYVTSGAALWASAAPINMFREGDNWGMF